MIIAALGIALMASAERTTRKRLKAKPAETVAEWVADTIANPGREKVAISGFDKTLRSRRESFFVTNNLSDTLMEIACNIIYTDLSGRQLHSREAVVKCPNLAPGETRNCNIPTWDRQGSFYYERSTAPRYSRATPFGVKFTVERAIVKGACRDERRSNR